LFSPYLININTSILSGKYLLQFFYLILYPYYLFVNLIARYLMPSYKMLILKVNSTVERDVEFNVIKISCRIKSEKFSCIEGSM
jgi:hypothetical protein